MGKMRLEFDLNNPDDDFGRKAALSATDMVFAVQNYDKWLRNKLKFAPEHTHERYLEGLQESRDELYRSFEVYGLDTLVVG